METPLATTIAGLGVSCLAMANGDRSSHDGAYDTFSVQIVKGAAMTKMKSSMVLDLDRYQCFYSTSILINKAFVGAQPLHVIIASVDDCLYRMTFCASGITWEVWRLEPRGHNLF